MEDDEFGHANSDQTRMITDLQHMMLQVTEDMRDFKAIVVEMLKQKETTQIDSENVEKFASASLGSTPVAVSKRKTTGQWFGETAFKNHLNPLSETSKIFPFAQNVDTKHVRSRKSILENVSISAEKERNKMVMYQQQPSFDHIKLTKLDVDSVIKFMRAFTEYQDKYGINLKGTTLISEDIQEEIISQYYHEDMDDASFFELSNAKLMEKIQKAVRPTDAPSFLAILDKSVSFNYSSKTPPETTEFLPFNTALLRYRKDFMSLVDFMSQHNADSVPRIDDKEGGLIHAFLKRIPFGYGKQVFNSIRKKYTDMENFTNDFYAAVKKQYKLCIEARALMHRYKQPTRPEQSATKPLADTRYHRSNLHHFAYGSGEGDGIGLAAHPFMTERDEEMSEEELDEEILNFSKHQSGAVKPGADGKTDRPAGCFKALFYGECNNKEHCKYSHEPSVLCLMHAFYQEKLDKSPHKPMKILQRPVSHITNSYSGSHDALSNMLLATVPQASFLRAVYKPGRLLLPDDAFLNIEPVLFDTGALSGNYISLPFVEKHRAQLAAYIRPSQSKVTLADSKTHVDISETVSLTVAFRDSAGTDHTASLDFHVLDTTANSMIVGLPAIINHFAELFREMLESVQEVRPVDQPLHAVTDAVYPWTMEIVPEAPEDASTPVPCSFPAVLDFLGKPPDEAVSEYLAAIPVQVSAEFLAATPIEQLLRTKGVNVFVPQNWSGINGLEPLQLDWREELLPSYIKPKARPVNPRLFENAKTEFERLKTYFYRDSKSDIASCLVIAPKATKPFIRFCGDYTKINDYISTGHYPIPHVQHELAKICKYKIFLDFDWTNAFHQIKLHDVTSARLSVQTPWGQVEPMFMPEGIGPASGILQSIVASVFADYAEWSIAIFDNLLVLAHDYDDAYAKVDLILNRCIERNLYLKFSKTWLGFDHANFFGYVCRLQHYELSQQRKDDLMAIAFPSSKKQMQSFLGSALFFKSFVPSFSDLSAPLNDMIKDGFDWSAPASWPRDYLSDFNTLKSALETARALYYPDYSLPWLVRTDASLIGVAAALFQLKDNGTDTPSLLPLAFVSQKFSDAATRWSTIEQEAYGCYFGVHSFAYYLRGKHFTLETDHHNLLWMEASEVPKVIRWRIFLQSFSFDLRHISGKKNLVADYFSRYPHEPALPPLAVLTALSLQSLSSSSGEEGVVPSAGTASDSAVVPTVDEVLHQVHGARMGHHGIARTMSFLDEYFSGHRIPQRVVEDFIKQCPVCQKYRLGMTATLKPTVRHLKPVHQRSTLGVDTLTITPADEFGNQYLLVVVNHFTKHAYGYPSADKTAVATATAIFQYVCAFGLADSIMSDPGSEFTAEVVQSLHKWLGIRHVFSLVDRHESNGVEGTNKQIVRHLKALVADERISKQWSAPTVLPLIFFIINSATSSETGVSPFHSTFGTKDATYHLLPAPTPDSDNLHEFVRLLDDNLAHIASVSKMYQDALVAKRTAANDPAKQNVYQPGDFVLFEQQTAVALPTKLTPRYKGPYVVHSQHKNDVTVRHLVQDSVHDLHVERLKRFFGSPDDAYEMALRDYNQYEVEKILAYRGDPMKRSTMQFHVLFKDGDTRWIPMIPDLTDSHPFNHYCTYNNPLRVLLYTAEEARRLVAERNRTAIKEVKPGDVVYVDLRSYGFGWYESLDLPDLDQLIYVLEYRYENFAGIKKLKIWCSCAVLNERFCVDHQFVFAYGCVFKLNPASMVLIDRAFVRRYPKVLGNSSV